MSAPIFHPPLSTLRFLTASASRLTTCRRFFCVNRNREDPRLTRFKIFQFFGAEIIIEDIVGDHDRLFFLNGDIFKTILFNQSEIILFLDGA